MSNESEYLSAAVTRLKKAGLRITQTRKSLLRVLLSEARPQTIGQLHESLGSDCCDLVTVYRILAAFESVGLTRRTFLHCGTALYTYESERTKFHIVSRSSETIDPMDPRDTLELEAALARVMDRLNAAGYSAISHSVQFYVD